MLSLSEVYSMFLNICEKVEGNDNFTSSHAQIDYILANYINISHDYKEYVVPLLEEELLQNSKSIWPTKYYKQFSELYQNMVEVEFAHKNYDSLNEAIKAAPMDQLDILLDCFARRSTLHYHRDRLEDSLIDIEHALNISQSSPLIDWKVKLLKELNRPNEAYDFLSNIIHRNEHSLTENGLILAKKLKKELKKMANFKREKSKFFNLIEHSTKFHLTIDPRVKIRKNYASRFNFKAKDTIPAGTEILNEEPMMFTCRADSLSRYCNNCRKKVVNVFWPCFNCKDVVFCSLNCLEQAELHRAECGLVKLIQEKFCKQALQVYNLLVKIGHLKLPKLIEKAKIFSLAEYCRNIPHSIKKSEAEEIFLLSHVETMERIASRNPLRSATEICQSFFLFFIYCFKMDLDVSDFKNADIVNIIDFLAKSIYKTQLNEYICHEMTEKGEKSEYANFQCLIGSIINHNCEPNAEWYFQDGHFKIKTLCDIEPNQEIAITYGVYKEEPLLARQRHLQKLGVMCCCQKCMEQVIQVFSIRCENCSGPIPYNSTEFPNQTCMICEKNYKDHSTMKAIETLFENIKRAVYLISHIDNKELLEKIESALVTISCYIYIHYEQFSDLVFKFCGLYFKLKLWDPAIEWYQWFVDGFNINLSFDKNDLIHYYNLKIWTHAYINYFLEKLANEQQISNNYLETAAYLFDKQSSLLNNNSKNWKSYEIMDQIQLDKLVKLLMNDIEENYYQLKQICLKALKFQGSTNIISDEDTSETTENTYTTSSEDELYSSYSL